MGNKVASELVSALRLSTLGTTLSSRTGARPPAMVDISSFPGVAKAIVKFFGDYNTPNTVCQIERSYNVSSVTYINRGQYRVVLNDKFINFGLGTGYVITGNVNAHSDFLTAANSFYVQNETNGNNAITLSSFRIFTLNTTTSGTSAANARYVNLAIF